MRMSKIGENNERIYRVVVIILTYNQKEKTLQCLSSLKQQMPPPFEILVWDNGSSDGSVEALQTAFPEVFTYPCNENLGVAGGRNAAAKLGIEKFAPTHLLFLDNDMLLEPGFVQALLEPFHTHPTLGQTQAKLRLMHEPEKLNDGGGARINFLLWQVTPVGFGEVDRGQYDTVRKCVSCGGAMMVRTEVFQQLGGFDMSFNPFGPEDLDFSLRLQKAGYQALFIPQAMAYHQVSHTFGRGYSETYARHKSRHWFLFMRRHATVLQQLGFFLIGVPYLFVRVILREGRKGNLKAIKGLIHGVLEYIRSATFSKGAR